MSDQPIIIKKIKKGGHGHHGGAWKVAYADFVTAMMAFFLLLWLLNSVTEEQLEGISNYFAPVAASSSTSGSGDELGGKIMAEDGAMSDMSSRPSVSMELPPPKAGEGSIEEAEKEVEAPKQESPEELPSQADLDAQKAEELMREKEEEQFQKAEQQLREAIEGIPELQQLAKSLLIENTPEGLRMQIVDQEGLAMFPRGSSEMFQHTRKIMELVAKVVQNTPQDVAISGHTDAVKFVSDSGYSNWELSADRANASRRALLDLGVPDDRIVRVVGRAATEPLLKDDPASARNRRVSIILLRGTGQQDGAEGAPDKG